MDGSAELRIFAAPLSRVIAGRRIFGARGRNLYDLPVIMNMILRKRYEVDEI